MCYVLLKKNFLQIIFLVTLLISLFYSFILNIHNSKELSSLKMITIAQRDSLSIFETILNNQSLLKPLEAASESKRLSSKMRLTDETGQEHLLTDLIQSPILVFRFSSSHCSACIEQSLAIVKSVLKEQDKTKIILLCSYDNLKKVKVLKQSNFIDYPVYNINETLKFPIEETSNPYFFIIDSDLTCKSFCAVVKEYPKFTTNYLKIIKHNYMCQ